MNSPQDLQIQLATTPDEIIDHFALRKTIFIEEQGVREALEMDGLDDQATLILAKMKAKPIGCARYRLLDHYVKVERVGVLQESRGQGIGQAIMRFIEQEVASSSPVLTIKLHAQDHAIPFYHHLGYQDIGEPFYEAGILHQAMIKHIEKAT
jgi:predicted GNAT family N-acyltransferase